MKRLILSVAVALLGASACSSNNGYNTTSTYYSVGSAQSDADLQAAGQVCDGRLGVVQNGWDTPDAYKQCMLAQGWEYGATTRTVRKDVYRDPRHPGLACHDFLIFGVVGQSCSNF